ncbi:MAG: Amuc_1102 family pilus-like protein [Chthoniobacteraceae bacterium]
MKAFSLALFSLVALAGGALAQVPVGPTSIKLGKAEISAPSTPEYQVTGGQNKRYKLGKWLEFEISYDTVPEEIDELTFKFTALIENKLLDGEVTYINIGKGKDHYAVMYISPKSLDKLTGGKTLTAASIQNVWVEVNRQGQLLGRESFKPGPQPNLPRVSGLVLNKTQTPFAPLFYDRYEEIKSTR